MENPAGRGESEVRLAASGSGTGGRTMGQKPSRDPTDRTVARGLGEQKLMERVITRCRGLILEACAYSSIPPEFLGALTANESGGDPKATRFEPAVYGYLKSVAEGKSPVYNWIRAKDLDAEIQEMLHPKAGGFHARYLVPPFPANHREAIAGLEEEALRELATSWGFTQIMGYHLVGRAGTVRDLLDPQFHYRFAIHLLAEFAQDFALDPAREFREMFRCWNTGSPYGRTYDPQYVEKGLERMEIYRASARRPAEGIEGAGTPA